MLRSTLALAFSLALVMACAKTSDNPPVVTAPTASAGAPAATDSAAVVTSATAASPPPEAGTPVSTAATDVPDAGATAAFQACQADSDCVAVPRVGCCNNGWKEAVNASQKDAYAASFTCAKRRPCPMYIIRDMRVPKCDPGTHLCQMVNAQP
jgi:hypothetical protein